MGLLPLGGGWEGARFLLAAWIYRHYCSQIRFQRVLVKPLFQRQKDGVVASDGADDFGEMGIVDVARQSAGIAWPALDDCQLSRKLHRHEAVPDGRALLPMLPHPSVVWILGQHIDGASLRRKALHHLQQLQVTRQGGLRHVYPFLRESLRQLILTANLLRLDNRLDDVESRLSCCHRVIYNLPFTIYHLFCNLTIPHLHLRHNLLPRRMANGTL